MPNAISESFTSATLSISAWDVDADDTYDPEVDDIYVFENSVGDFVLIGSLDGANDEYSYTSFALGSEFFDDIANGLQVFMDIDATNTSPYDNWAVTLAKSVISCDGAVIPDPDPNPVPEPGSVTLILLGCLSFIGCTIRRKK